MCYSLLVYHVLQQPNILFQSYDFVQDQIYAIERLDYNEASLKRVTQDGDTLILNPCNPEYHAMVTDYEEVRIIGRCVGVLHKYV